MRNGGDFFLLGYGFFFVGVAFLGRLLHENNISFNNIIVILLLAFGFAPVFYFQKRLNQKKYLSKKETKFQDGSMFRLKLFLKKNTVLIIYLNILLIYCLFCFFG